MTLRAARPDYVPALVNAGGDTRIVDENYRRRAAHVSHRRCRKPARDVTLRPFYRTHNRRYTVYWDSFTPEVVGVKIKRDTRPT